MLYSQRIDVKTGQTAVTFFNEDLSRRCDLNKVVDANVQEDVMKKRAFWGLAAVALLAISASEGFSSQVQPGQNRIPQEVVINGQMVTAASVTTAQGQIQSFTCSSPQHYVTPEGSSQGWACYEQTSGVWLLNAVPPVQAQSAPAPAVAAPVPVPAPLPQQPAVQQAPAPVYQQRPVRAYPQSAPIIIYQQPPTVIYQQPAVYPQATVVYQQQPAVVYQQPSVVYASPYPVYSPSVVLGAAAINAVGRIASAAIIGSRYPAYYPVRVRGWR